MLGVKNVLLPHYSHMTTNHNYSSFVYIVCHIQLNSSVCCECDIVTTKGVAMFVYIIKNVLCMYTYQ